MTKAKEKNYVAIAARYAGDVVSGKILACQWAIKACRRQIDDLEKVKSKSYAYKFDKDSASRICRFIELPPHIKGERAPVFILDCGCARRSYPGARPALLRKQSNRLYHQGFEGVMFIGIVGTVTGAGTAALTIRRPPEAYHPRCRDACSRSHSGHLTV